MNFEIFSIRPGKKITLFPLEKQSLQDLIMVIKFPKRFYNIDYISRLKFQKNELKNVVKYRNIRGICRHSSQKRKNGKKKPSAGNFLPYQGIIYARSPK